MIHRLIKSEYYQQQKPEITKGGKYKGITLVKESS